MAGKVDFSLFLLPSGVLSHSLALQPMLDFVPYDL